MLLEFRWERLAAMTADCGPGPGSMILGNVLTPFAAKEPNLAAKPCFDPVRHLQSR
jgi:hypothetical protein